MILYLFLQGILGGWRSSSRKIQRELSEAVSTDTAKQMRELVNNTYMYIAVSLVVDSDRKTEGETTHKQLYNFFLCPSIFGSGLEFKFFLMGVLNFSFFL